MTLLRTALHYGGATALLLAAGRFVSILPGKPYVVHVGFRDAGVERDIATPCTWWRLSYVEIERVIVVRAPMREVYRVREIYREVPVDGTSTFHSEDATVSAAEALCRTAEERARRGDRPDRVEVATEHERR